MPQPDCPQPFLLIGKNPVPAVFPRIFYTADHPTYGGQLASFVQATRIHFGDGAQA